MFGVTLHELRRSLDEYYRLRFRLFERARAGNADLEGEANPYPDGAGAISLMLILVFGVLTLVAATFTIYGFRA